ncbi:WAT1-related protein At1g43650-like isoform X2 [Mangifera indica]|uniref:WAT1-related protein At1g43650-like isoform X2 n=1 Tax=Mangifera indica TaxID=29780 RepID=UPI001CFACC80|nr:WAT1-related protein At1g43650-like isoform X2 [Mangifera indica]
MVQMKPYMALLLVELSYAGMALLSKAAVAGGISPSVFVVYRQALASLALAPFAFFLESNETSPLSYYLLCKIFLLALIGLTLSLNLYLVGINYTTATFASAIPNTLPATTFVLAALLRMESVSIRHIYGIAKVLGSVGIIVKQYPAKIRLTTLQCFFSCIQSAIWAAVSERHNPSAWKLGWNIDLLSVAYCGVVVNGITYLLQVWAIEKKGPVFAALFTPVALIVTAIFSAFFFKEILYWGSVAGAVLLVVGLYSVLWGKNKEAKTVTNNEENPETEAETTTKP